MKMETDVKPSSNTSCTEHATHPNLNENSSQTWKNFTVKMNESIDHRNIRINCSKLLKKFSQTSILGDICFNIRGKKYLFDRVILALRSKYLRFFFEIHAPQGKDEQLIGQRLSEHLKGGNRLIDTFFGIVYGKADLNSTINVNNYLILFHNVFQMEMEIDLRIIKNLIEKTAANVESYHDIIYLQNYLSAFDNHHNYLLPTVAKFLSDHLHIYREVCTKIVLEKELFILILLHKTNSLQEKYTIGRICAEWICQDFKTRIIHLKDLVNAVKYRFDLLPYCDLNPDLMMRSLEKISAPNVPGIPEVTKYFNELLSYDGKVSYELPSNLKIELCKVDSQEHICNPIDETAAWKTFLKDEFLCDVAINVQGTIFKLHRIKLLSASRYFYNLFIPIGIHTQRISTMRPQKAPMQEYSIDQIDPVTFKTIIRYIYYEDVEITSLTQLMSLYKGSKFLQLDQLFETCASKMSEMARNSPVYLFEIFLFVCEMNDKYSDMYNKLVKQIINSWLKLGEHPQFKDVSLLVLQEIIKLPELKIDHPDQILDLCSKWIYHDVKNRYEFIIEIAKTINRNLMTDIEPSLETPSNSDNYSQQYIKNQLIRILSSATLIPSVVDCSLNNEDEKPRFILKCSKKVKNEPGERELQTVSECHSNVELLNDEAHFLTVVDMNFNKIVQLAQVGINAQWQSSATMIDSRLFILFNINDQFHFQVYHFPTNTMISLATNVKMNSRFKYTILNCNGEVYFCTDEILLKYCVELNRWITFLNGTRTENSLYTSDGNKLYKTFVERELNSNNYVNKSSFFDFTLKTWTSMPDIPISVKVTRDAEGSLKFCNIPSQVNVINQDLSVLFESQTLVFHNVSQKWSNIENSCKSMVQFTNHGRDILYLSRENEVHLFSPTLNEWSVVQKLPADVDRIVAIHVIMNRYLD
ncbi:uncharacterized protein LOC135832897 [Planococcus citri]|uniref:uncharacterized protein LOC135832897 n=1 Tax=Planococcus citri TaxID=170843 RepID=UPI0031F8F18B